MQCGLASSTVQAITDAGRAAEELYGSAEARVVAEGAAARAALAQAEATELMRKGLADCAAAATARVKELEEQLMQREAARHNGQVANNTASAPTNAYFTRKVTAPTSTAAATPHLVSPLRNRIFESRAGCPTTTATGMYSAALAPTPQSMGPAVAFSPERLTDAPVTGIMDTLPASATSPTGTTPGYVNTSQRILELRNRFEALRLRPRPPMQ